MALVAQFVSQYDASNRAQFFVQYAEDAAATTLITTIDAGNVDPDLSTITGADTLTPLIYLYARPETGEWRHMFWASNTVGGKTVTFRLDRGTMNESSFPPAANWLPMWTQDVSVPSPVWTQAASRTLVGSSSSDPDFYIEFEFADLPSGMVYFATQPLKPNSYAAIFADELLNDYSSVADPTLSADASGVYNTTPAEVDEDGREVGENSQYAIKLSWPGPTTDGGPKRKNVQFAGIHAAGEQTSWISFEAAIRWLLDDLSTEAQNLRANWDFYLYFNVTANGIVAGESRMNPSRNIDPNRDFVDKDLQEIQALTTAVLADTGGQADAQFSWHGFSRETRDFIPGTGSSPNAATAAFVDNGFDIFVDPRTYYVSVPDAGYFWGYNTLGCTVAFASEVPQRGNTSSSFYEEIGVNWMKTLEVTDSQGYFYTPVPGQIFPTAAVSVSTAYDPVVSTETTGATVTPTAAASVSLAYDPSVTTNVIVLPTLAQSVSLAHEPRVRAGRIPPTQRIIIQGVYSTRSVIQGRYQR